MTILVTDSEELNGTEIIQIYGSSQLTTSQSIANLAGGTGGGVQNETIVLSGTSITVTDLNTFVGWNSSTVGGKTTTILRSSGSLDIIVVNDLIGTAYTYPITIVPVSGPSIIGPNSVYTDYGSITLLDTSVGWISI